MVTLTPAVEINVDSDPASLHTFVQNAMALILSPLTVLRESLIKGFQKNPDNAWFFLQLDDLCDL